MKRSIYLVTYLMLAVFLGSAIVVNAELAEAKTLNFALAGNPDTLDPHKTSGTLTFQTIKSFYDTLAEPDMNGKIVPALAEKWAVSDDALVWTFYLKKDVEFHNGSKLTSKDVKATFERIMDKATGSPKAKEFKSIIGIEIPDDFTVVLKVKEPTSPLLASLASGWGAILPKDLIEAGHDFGAQPVGTGPFVLKKWIRDSQIVLEKNNNYWMKGLPRLDKISMHIIPERAVSVQGLISGQVDVAYVIDKDDLPMLEASPDVKIEKSLTALIMVMSMNCSNPALKDVRVRQAINHAIDKQQVLDVAYGGGKTIGTFMDYGNAYYKDFTGLYPYDPEKAKALLAEAGIGPDTTLELFLPQNYELHVKAGEMYQDMLTKVGLNVKIKLVDWSTWLSDVYRGTKYDLTVIGHTGKLDPDGTLAGYGTEDRYVKWINPRTAELIAGAKKVSGFENRKKMYDEALEIMAKEVPFMYLGSSYRYPAVRKNVSDFRMTPKLDTFDFRWTRVE
ncbi:MAG: ABC transporter substrate-binding protein [Desulfobacterales bacterium]